MRRSEADVGLGIAVVLASSLTGIVAWIALDEMTSAGFSGEGPIWPLFAFGSVGISASWLGVWAWRRQRWLIAALGFILSIASPVGYLVEITGPVAIALVIVALRRGWRDRTTAMSEPSAPRAPG